MSKYSTKLSLLAAGLAIALVAPSAFAITLTADSAATKVAAVDVKDNTTVVAMAAFSIGVSNSDLIIGRTTGFSVRVDLANGAKFNALGAPTIGAALTAGTAWSATVAAGGVGQSFVVYSVQPVAGSAGVINGAALSWAADAIKLDTVSNLSTSGNTASATVTFADPNTAQQILAPKTAIVASSDNALSFSVDTTSANANSRIDVGANTTLGSASKTRFSPTGVLSDGAGVTWYNPGKIVIGVKAGVMSTAASATAFTWSGADTAALTLTGDFSAFTAANGGKALLVAAGGCTSAAPTVVSTGVVTASTIVFSDTYTNTHNQDICLIASGTKVISTTATPVSAVVTRTAASRSNNGSGAGLPLLYNGANAKVDHFNPASNATVQSYLRVTNTSDAAGKLSIKLTCDTGTSPGTAVVNSLGAGQSILIESGNLENGTGPVNVGSGSCASGKGRLDLTGEFGTMAVQNFMRNIISSGVINVNTNNQN